MYTYLILWLLFVRLPLPSCVGIVFMISVTKESSLPLKNNRSKMKFRPPTAFYILVPLKVPIGVSLLHNRFDSVYRDKNDTYLEKPFYFSNKITQKKAIL